MTVQQAIAAVAASEALAREAGDAWETNAAQLEELGANTDRRIASIVGQCGHESGGFRYKTENLNYSGDALQRVFGKYFPSAEIAAEYARQPEKIANRVYADRMGNGPESSGDGWRYRGRGYIQLTGRDNYALYGTTLRLPFVDNPQYAADPKNAWLVAVNYFGRTRRGGKTLLEWADADDEVMVTKGINGGTNGLSDRTVLVGKAYAAMTGQTTTVEWQTLLAHAGYDPGAIDGLWGPNTKSAMDAAEAQYGLTGEPLADKLRAVA